MSAMVVDTSALVAASWNEPGYQDIVEALLTDPGFIPAPVLIEYERVISRRDVRAKVPAADFLNELITAGLVILPFDAAAAQAAVDANARFGSGTGAGGKLNMLDLMVYGVAKVLALPILCTGKDFTATDALIHPASRRD
ncbi:type II toxin-antitoxin system VapC family toxin [Glacieibacterium frigidum]|uniref:Ribonuclease VapC n=1 Tax=Glacieibacterium frigidum TaxID=2593303 RepID=A0A552U8Y5_9SPHN|nr:type II toxin-antitoxin system VapC family toxin [Glacieibacterium frigidum]TRW14687.1 type II toxin-antitoxin system VapC family toxin [Glacieibacterium frigidum]